LPLLETHAPLFVGLFGGATLSIRPWVSRKTIDIHRVIHTLHTMAMLHPESVGFQEGSMGLQEGTMGLQEGSMGLQEGGSTVEGRCRVLRVSLRVVKTAATMLRKGENP
jgi:hypothetical protein